MEKVDLLNKKLERTITAMKNIWLCNLLLAIAVAISMSAWFQHRFFRNYYAQRDQMQKLAMSWIASKMTLEEAEGSARGAGLPTEELKKVEFLQHTAGGKETRVTALFWGLTPKRGCAVGPDIQVEFDGTGHAEKVEVYDIEFQDYL